MVEKGPKNSGKAPPLSGNARKKTVFYVRSSLTLTPEMSLLTTGSLFSLKNSPAMVSTPSMPGF